MTINTKDLFKKYVCSKFGYLFLVLLAKWNLFYCVCVFVLLLKKIQINLAGHIPQDSMVSPVLFRIFNWRSVELYGRSVELEVFSYAVSKETADTCLCFEHDSNPQSETGLSCSIASEYHCSLLRCWPINSCSILTLFSTAHFMFHNFKIKDRVGFGSPKNRGCIFHSLEGLKIFSGQWSPNRDSNAVPSEYDIWVAVYVTVFRLYGWN